MAKRIGLMAGEIGRLEEQLLDAWQREPGISGELVEFGTTGEGHLSRYDAIVDLMWPRVPCYDAYARAAAMAGARVVNDPFALQRLDGFLAQMVVQRLGLPGLRCVLLPQQRYAPEVRTDVVLHNLECPIRWEALGAYVGYPAALVDVQDAGWRRPVGDLPSLWRAFDEAGERVVMVQAQPVGRTARVLCVAGTTLLRPEGDAKNPTPAQTHALQVMALQVTESLGLVVNEVGFSLTEAGPVVSSPWALGLPLPPETASSLAAHAVKAARWSRRQAPLPVDMNFVLATAGE